jgi:hypothetical protein
MERRELTSSQVARHLFVRASLHRPDHPVDSGSVKHASLNALSVSLIVHVAIERRRPCPASPAPRGGAADDTTVRLGLLPDKSPAAKEATVACLTAGHANSTDIQVYYEDDSTG